MGRHTRCESRGRAEADKALLGVREPWSRIRSELGTGRPDTGAEPRLAHGRGSALLSS